MREQWLQRLKIPADRIEAINAVLLGGHLQAIEALLAVVEEFGGPEQINRQAEAARRLPALLEQVERVRPEYLCDLRWLIEQRDAGGFISIADYRRRLLGERAEHMRFTDHGAVTLEISACQYDAGGAPRPRAGRADAGPVHPGAQDEGTGRGR
jgi:hypothetical protein